MRLHMPGLPHTVTNDRFSHCAFTGKILKFIPMMRAQGCEVLHYGVGTVNPGADEHVPLMTEEIQHVLLGHDHSDPAAFVGNDGNIAHPVYRIFNRELGKALKARVQAGDFVCLPFGIGHQEGVGDHPGINVETGIGYPVCFSKFRIYESYNWMTWHQARADQGGDDYNWVIPNYFDQTRWPLHLGARKYLLYFGRITPIKGINIVRAIAEARPDLDVVMCGQGDPAPWLSADVPNLRALPPVHGDARAALLGHAIALLAPSRYIEPFCGVTVEANLTGTPALTSDFGVFNETIEPGFNGHRCRTLGDWLAAVEWAEDVHERQTVMIAQDARDRYSLEAIGPRYVQVFNQIRDLAGKGWYTRSSHIGPITKATGPS